MEAPDLPESDALTAIEREEAREHRLFEDALPLPNQRKELRKAAAIEMMAAGMGPSEVAAAIGVNRVTLFRWRQEDPTFDERLTAALNVTLEKLKREAERRAVNGSDKLLMFLLERYDPATFHLAQKLEHSGAVDLASAVLAGRRRAAVDDEPGSDLV